MATHYTDGFDGISNIVFIGMAGAGKSTIGKSLCESLDYTFIDTDRLIEKNSGQTLQQLLEAEGYLSLRQLEENVLVNLEPQQSVISTGGSAVYSAKGMAHLKQFSTVIFSGM